MDDILFTVKEERVHFSLICLLSWMSSDVGNWVKRKKFVKKKKVV